MHLLLPPSEAKSPGGRGRPLRGRDSLLAEPRAAVAAALLDLVSENPASAAAALALPPGTAAQALQVNAAVLDSRTMPALRRYTGTVYAGLDYAGLSTAGQRLADRRVLVFSGLLGVVRGDEAVPDHRVPAAAVLPGLGVAGTFWRRVLAGPLDDLLARGLVVDLRSGDYAAMWRPQPAQRARVVTVRVLSPLPRGGHGVISYASKLAKGRLARALLERQAQGVGVTDPAGVAAAWRSCGGAGVEPSATGLDLYTG